MAIMLSGSVSVPFFIDFSETHFEYKVENTGMTTLFVLGTEPWSRFLPFAERFQWIITDQPVGNVPNAISMDELCDEGTARLVDDPALIQRLADRISPDDLAAIIYTSGSTGMPKGVELTHGNLISQLRDIAPLFARAEDGGRAISLLPVAHSFERMVIYLYLAQGMDIYFVDDIGNLGPLMQEVRPTMMAVVPRLLEKIYNQIREKVAALSGPRGWIARWALRRANRNEKRVPLDSLADRLVGGKIRAVFGGSLRAVIVGGAHMPEPLNRFFTRAGIPIYEGYGLTESAPVICVNHLGQSRIGTVGCPLASVEIALTNEGEVLARGPNIMRGYHHQPVETARVIDSDGWLHTGDLGRIDEEGYLTIMARKKEMFKTSTGETIFPGPVEQDLCRSARIETACIIAESRKHVACLLFLSPSAAVLPAADLRQEIEAHIRQVNTDLDHWEKIHAYALLPEVPSVANGELTPTLKIRRHVVEEHYRELIERLYDETEWTEKPHEFEIGHC